MISLSIRNPLFTIKYDFFVIDNIIIIMAAFPSPSITISNTHAISFIYIYIYIETARAPKEKWLPRSIIDPTLFFVFHLLLIVEEVAH